MKSKSQNIVQDILRHFKTFKTILLIRSLHCIYIMSTIEIITIMQNYTISYTLPSTKQLKSLVVVIEPKHHILLIQICDEIYETNCVLSTDILIYFFGNNEDAVRFTYLMMVENKKEDEAMNSTNCFAYLKGKNLHRIGTSELLKNYSISTLPSA